MAEKRTSTATKRARVFGQASQKQKSVPRVALYARVSTHDQQTLPLQLAALRKYAKQRGWSVVEELQEIGSGSLERPKREQLMKLARQKEMDVILVWRLDRWGRSVADLAVNLQELHELGIAFVSLTEALDLTTPSGRAMAGLLAVFAEFEKEILRERVLAGLAQARRKGTRLGRPRTAARRATQVYELYNTGTSKAEIARLLRIGRTSVRRILVTGKDA
jgi:DNA invertase Pin-like site-specific DNA recombinase